MGSYLVFTKESCTLRVLIVKEWGFEVQVVCRLSSGIDKQLHFLKTHVQDT